MSMFIIIGIAISTYIAVFGVLGIIRAPDILQRRSFANVSKVISEIVMIYVCPPIGISITDATCDTHPFESPSLPTAYTLWALFASAYLVSRCFKKHLSPLMGLLVSTLLIMGFVYCVVLSIHFSPMDVGLVIPVIGLLLLSPILGAMYLFKEIRRSNAHYRSYFDGLAERSAGRLFTWYQWLSRNHFWFSSYLLAPLLLLVQAVLYLAGQHPDSIISQFTESCGYLFSKQQDCSCGGDHYLCSIAANGDQRLVKPLRFGVRQNEKILVNRQLLIANAFEQWLEDHAPRFHRVVRNTYDAMNIPVNAWSKHRRTANVIYILMKPLEWLFLLWLYAFDKKPENRIAMQYFPKKELQAYIQQAKKAQ